MIDSFLTIYIVYKLGCAAIPIAVITGIITIVMFIFMMVQIDCRNEDADKIPMKWIKWCLPAFILSVAFAVFTPSEQEAKIGYTLFALKAGIETELSQEALNTLTLYVKDLKKDIISKRSRDD